MAVDSLERDCRPALPRLDSCGYDDQLLRSAKDSFKNPSRISRLGSLVLLVISRRIQFDYLIHYG